MSDPIAPHSAPIVAYMSAHEATNLAYVRYFGKADKATKANFVALDSKSFTLEYELPDDPRTFQVKIFFRKPLTKREEIRIALEEMAKEAETSLGLPSSLSGPPPLKAIGKAMLASTEIYTPPSPKVPLDSFYLPKRRELINIGVSLGLLTLVALPSHNSIKPYPFLVTIREKVGAELLYKIWKGLAVIHALESGFVFLSCLRRGWYGPVNVLKWTVSTFFFGVGSIAQFNQHAKDVSG